MKPTSNWTDLEGALVALPGPGKPHYAKCLSTQRAWQVFDPHRLVDDVADSPVQSVTTDMTEGVQHLHYRPDLEPLDLEQLRELIRLERPMGGWRLARLALDLATQLGELHAAGFPQVVIHPERVGGLPDRFVLIPTLPGILLPLHETLENQAANWLYFIAPEVLRTRASDASLLVSGDVFSLGRLLALLCVPGWSPLSYVDPHALAERRVEHVEPDPFGVPPPSLQRLTALCARMCEFLPENRPALAQARSELEEIVALWDPEARFPELLARGKAPVQEYLRDLEDTCRCSSFRCPHELIQLLRADLALQETPPDFARSLGELSRVFPGSFKVRQRIGRTYAAYEQHAQHLQLSHEAYQMAAAQSHWTPAVLDEWVQVLTRFDDHDEVLKSTSCVPAGSRTVRLVLLRTLRRLQKDQPLDAWHEIAPSFAHFEFDEALFELASRVALANDPLDLMRWLYQHQDKRGMAAPLALVWVRNGNLELAERSLEQARHFKP